MLFGKPSPNKFIYNNKTGSSMQFNAVISLTLVRIILMYIWIYMDIYILAVVIRRESRRIKIFDSSHAIPDKLNFFYSSVTNQINKIMYFGILFNSCFSLFNSFIEMTTREINFNKKSFLKTLKTSQFI